MNTSPAIRALLMSAGALPGHVFTNPDGKTFEGDIASGDDKTVTITRSTDKKTFTVERASLSEADQTHVAKWITENPSFRLSIKAVKKSEDSQKTESGRTSSSFYEVEIRNESSQPTPPLTMRYIQRQLRNGSSMDNVGRPFSEDQAFVPAIPALKSTTVRCSSVLTQSSSSSDTRTAGVQNGRRIQQTTYSKTRTSLSGITLVLIHNEKRVGQYSMVEMAKQTEQLLQEKNRGASPAP